MGGYNTRGFVEVLAASQSPVNKNWFQGTADAVRQYMWLFDEAVRDGVEDFLILSGEETGVHSRHAKGLKHRGLQAGMPWHTPTRPLMQPVLSEQVHLDCCLSVMNPHP